jgi:hypothetical protein
MSDLVTCRCGRSESGFCDGSHKLTNEQFKLKLAEQQLNENKQQLLNETTGN